MLAPTSPLTEPALGEVHSRLRAHITRYLERAPTQSNWQKELSAVGSRMCDAADQILACTNGTANAGKSTTANVLVGRLAFVAREIQVTFTPMVIAGEGADSTALLERLRASFDVEIVNDAERATRRCVPGERPRVLFLKLIAGGLRAGLSTLDAPDFNSTPDNRALAIAAAHASDIVFLCCTPENVHLEETREALRELCDTGRPVVAVVTKADGPQQARRILADLVRRSSARPGERSIGIEPFAAHIPYLPEETRFPSTAPGEVPPFAVALTPVPDYPFLDLFSPEIGPETRKRAKLHAAIGNTIDSTERGVRALQAIVDEANRAEVTLAKARAVAKDLGAGLLDMLFPSAHVMALVARMAAERAGPVAEFLHDWGPAQLAAKALEWAGKKIAKKPGASELQTGFEQGIERIESRVATSYAQRIASCELVSWCPLGSTTVEGAVALRDLTRSLISKAASVFLPPAREGDAIRLELAAALEAKLRAVFLEWFAASSSRQRRFILAVVLHLFPLVQAALVVWSLGIGGVGLPEILLGSAFAMESLLQWAVGKDFGLLGRFRAEFADHCGPALEAALLEALFPGLSTHVAALGSRRAVARRDLEDLTTLRDGALQLRQTLPPLQ